jgi:hypothetical protein
MEDPIQPHSNEPHLNEVNVSSNEVSGTSFSFLIKLLSSVLILGIGYYSAQVLPRLDEMSWSTMGFVGAVAVVIVFFQLSIWFSSTHISETHIYQTWMFRKKVAIKDIAQCKLIYVPFFSWIITPRLVVRVGMANFFVFYASNPHVLEKFLALVYKKSTSL